MTRRTVAWLVAVPMLVIAWLVIVLKPLPFVVYSPGVTVNLLGDFDNEPVIQVEGHKVYRDDGELRLTTIYVSGPKQRVTLPELVQSWFSSDDAIYPRDTVYAPDVTAEEDRAASQAMMVSSQDIAVANAVKALGYEVKQVVQIASVLEGGPADGKLRSGDQIRKVNDTVVTALKDVSRAVTAAGSGTPVRFELERNRKPLKVSVTPTEVKGEPRVGITLGPAFDLPFDVTLNMDPNIGGPSAGLMFSLAVYDTLTPGSLTDGRTIAGTGTAEMDGSVGPIGGIQQKISAAHDAGAKLFLVPKDNCGEAVGAPDADSLRLVRADTMSGAAESLKKWAADPDATLPTCPQ